MPSMHISIAILIILASIRTHRWLVRILAPFGIVMLVGSIYLGWHYAVACHVGFGATIGLWWISGRIVRAWDRQSPGIAIGT